MPPRPSYAPSRAPTKTVNNTTIIQQRSGGGFMSSMFGSFAGIGTYNWLFNNDEQQQQQAPVAVPGAAN